ncbi:hypothetical protein CI238_00640 [Colletotrichum incanum]|uniref:Uncharacterized protein n=1 Tax=Colletotrichum incanum TaxID=1573173 RepID=A0A166M1M3_COLIC|nr:hypothetical protein CI238_00640 [Colletotrichum incanum]OHW92157.1 hypothetical protein CSPAE12_09168 [Colletotrichum incanum]
MPQGAVPYARPGSGLVILQRTPRVTNFYKSARSIVFMLILLSITASIILTVVISKMRPDVYKHSVVVALAVFLAICQNGTLLGFVLHNCIGLPPTGLGKTIFIYYFMWIVMQAVGFVFIDQMWLHSWPELVKNLCVTWMLLSVLTVGFWTIGIVAVIGKRYERQLSTSSTATRRTESSQMQTRGLAPVVAREARDEESATPVRPPPYVSVREVKNQNA